MPFVSPTSTPPPALTPNPPSEKYKRLYKYLLLVTHSPMNLKKKQKKRNSRRHCHLSPPPPTHPPLRGTPPPPCMLALVLCRAALFITGKTCLFFGELVLLPLFPAILANNNNCTPPPSPLPPNLSVCQCRSCLRQKQFCVCYLHFFVHYHNSNSPVFFSLALLPPHRDCHSLPSSHRHSPSYTLPATNCHPHTTPSFLSSSHGKAVSFWRPHTL